MQIIVSILLSVCLVETYHVPQVYEATNDFALFGDERKLKESDTESVESNFKFVYPPAYQKDQLKWRYFQQQIADAKNMAKYRDDRMRAEKYSVTVIPTDVILKQFANKHYGVKRRNDENRRKLSRKSRAIEKRNFLKDSLMVESNVDQRHLQNQQNTHNDHNEVASQKNIYYLTEMLGKHPNDELKNLQYVLTNQPTPMPFRIQHNDNVKTETRESDDQEFILKSGDTLTQLQAHFDALSQAEAENALAHAYQRAIADVESQHEAMLLAKDQAEKAALDQILRAQAEAETLAYIQSQSQNTQQHEQLHQQQQQQAEQVQHEQIQHEQPVVIQTALVQQKPVNIKLQNALLHAQKQAQAYQHYSLKTHLPRVDQKYQFKEETATSQNKIVPINDENDVSNSLKKHLISNQIYKISLLDDGNRTKRDTNFNYTNATTTLIASNVKLDRRSYRSPFRKLKYSKKHHNKHTRPIYVPEKHHYYHIITEKPVKDSTTEENKESKIIVNINNHNNSNKEKEKHTNVNKRRRKHRKHRRSRYRNHYKPFWHKTIRRPRLFVNKKLHKAFHKFRV